MATARKFTFDLDFDAPQDEDAPEIAEIEEEPEEEIPTFSEEEVAQAREEGRQQGHEEGRKEAAEATEERLLEAVEKAADELANVYNAQAEANRDIAKEMTLIATAITRKMFPDLNARNALGEVERVVQETLKAITEEPRAQIIVHPDLREPFMERLATMTHRAGFEGKVFINPDPSLAMGDCRIEWSNGAAVRDTEALMEEIDKIVERNLHDDMDNDITEPEDAPKDAPKDANEALQEDNAHENETTDEAPEPEATTAPETDQQPGDATGDMAPEGESMPDETVEPDSTATPEPEMMDESPSADTAMGAAPADNEMLPQPSFEPTVEPEEDPANIENTDLNQSVESAEGEAPMPNIDSAPESSGDADESAADSDAPVPTFDAPDPVSPDMAAAILDAQSEDGATGGDAAADDDDEDPTSGT